MQPQMRLQEGNVPARDLQIQILQKRILMRLRLHYPHPESGGFSLPDIAQQIVLQ